ncbi:Ldh family oxidoreductase [Stenotrophomonas sp. MMGLT7]|uniref:Ldh family oxidoreductase n=1 Tax=Stenotrophomonas sp. MMGLT7 TaxID=2901227 RepID=UPI001E34837E|nr:Ldh family oxidoreductase [Stenotrophomonas sp. MMGLT7]MCD7098091.1 Ldh family oxidoreductase [Stenotrophomonas sp. MMGLT7]
MNQILDPDQASVLPPPAPEQVRLSWDEAQALVQRALQAAGALPENAAPTAQALVLAEAQGLASHGLGRIPSYVGHLRSGRVLGTVHPVVAHQRGAVLLIDARNGLAFAACAQGMQQALEIARRQGVALLGVTNSHHAGVLVDHLRPVAAAGMVGVAVANASACMPAAGGKRALFGTNPIAAIFPRRAGAQPADPIMIDLALSEVARGKLMTAAQRGQSIPLGWALDRDGQPTTDPKAGLEGTLLPIGATTSPKGAMLALMVEVLAGALLGANLGTEMGSFFTHDGAPLRMGHLFIVIDPGALAGQDGYYARVEDLVSTMLEEEGVRLAGARRLALERQARIHGVQIPRALYEQIEELAR